MQKTGLEWIYRFLQEPRRLGTRYAKNLYFIWRVTLGTLFSRRNRMLVSANLGSATSI
jgi:N-acetylglucosaminyldiphosphoundecaprenol N-acetyl-beta-D-mannosaminyltransferase